MKKQLLLIAFGVFLQQSGMAQKAYSTVTQIDTLLLNSKNDKTHLFTQPVLKQYIYSQINKLSGTNIKEGKIASKSVSVDEKSVTFNVAGKCKRFFYQPTFSVAAEDGFAVIFSNKEYQRTYTIGSNFQYFLGNNSIGYTDEYATRLHNMMKLKRAFYEKLEKDELYRRMNALMQDYIAAYKEGIHFYNLIDNDELLDYTKLDTFGKKAFEAKNKLDEIIRQMAKMNIIKAGDKYGNYYDACKITLVTIDSLRPKGDSIKALLDNAYLAYQDSLQLSSKIGHGIRWFSASAKYNTNLQEILTDTTKTKPTKYYNEYTTLKFGFNYLKSRMNTDKLYLSCNGNFSSIRNFKPGNKKTSNFNSNSTLGGVQVVNVDSTISYYTAIPSRAYALSCDLNLTYFFTRRKFGIDLGVTAGVNDPQDNNINARFGIYVPFTVADKNIYIEPILKFNKLFSSAGNEFLKDNLTFGFNISVALPDFLK
ncbi:MAG: hypothetical protein WC716_15140 [Chitinophagaceae bacterium]|jgi:hypothetical protein